MINEKISNQVCQRGFSLFELLVVLAIIAVVAGIGIPAVSSIREAARIVECSNNLRNHCLGMLAYESSYRSFPPGQDAPTDVEFLQPIDWSGFSGLGHLWYSMPYLEQADVYHQFVEYAVSNSLWLSDGLSKTEGLNIPSFRCPSDLYEPVVFLHYSILNAGANQSLTIATTVVADDHFGFTNYLGSRGTDLYGRTNGPVVHTGMFYESSAVRMADVRDGTSNTFLIGELTGGTTGPNQVGTVNIRHSVFQNGIGGTLNFFADETDDLVDDLALMFSSNHRGGTQVNLGFVDGHVEAKSSDTDFNLMRALTTRSGVFE